MSVAQVCELYGVKKQTVSDIKKARGKLENYAVKFAVSGKGDATRKHMKDPKCVELDLAMHKVAPRMYLSLFSKTQNNIWALSKACIRKMSVPSTVGFHLIHVPCR